MSENKLSSNTDSTLHVTRLAFPQTSGDTQHWHGASTPLGLPIACAWTITLLPMFPMLPPTRKLPHSWSARPKATQVPPAQMPSDTDRTWLTAVRLCSQEHHLLSECLQQLHECVTHYLSNNGSNLYPFQLLFFLSYNSKCTHTKHFNWLN